MQKKEEVFKIPSFFFKSYEPFDFDFQKVLEKMNKAFKINYFQNFMLIEAFPPVMRVISDQIDLQRSVQD